MSEGAKDQPVGIRQGEELDLASLAAYLKEKLPAFEGPGPLRVKQFPRGFSNLTYLLEYGETQWVLRRPPFGANIKSAHDMDREFRVLSLLQPVYPYVPKPLVYCDDESVIGAPFYLMERVEGVILRDRPPQGLNLTPEVMGSISRLAVENLAALHNLDLQSTGLVNFGKPEGYIQRQVEGWSRRYQKAETDKVSDMDELIKWMPANMPKSTDVSFIHNDYKYDNLVLNFDGGEPTLKAVLDWEMATVGDRWMDLGTSLAYWAEPNDHDALKPFNLTWIPGNYHRTEVFNQYAKRSNVSAPSPLFYYVYGSFKVGVIVQQIYARYKQGFTQDPRFAGLLQVVKSCAQNGVRAIELNRISNLYP